MTQLWLLTEEAKKAWLDEGHIEGVILEPYLLKVLNHIKQNTTFKKEQLKYFHDLIIDGSLGPFEIIVFCMRELQWQEVATMAQERSKATNDPRTISVMQNILAVYEEDWEDSDLYEYYSKTIE